MISGSIEDRYIPRSSRTGYARCGTLAGGEDQIGGTSHSNAGYELNMTKWAGVVTKTEISLHSEPRGFRPGKFVAIPSKEKESHFLSELDFSIKHRATRLMA
jgi:hypothetical protein